MSDLITAQTPTADHVRLALSLMADGAHMVLSGVPDDPSLATYSFPGHVSKALHAQLADAQAAVAMVVERAVEIGANIAQRTRPDGFPEEASNAYHSGAMDVVDAIRDLAPADGLAAAEALRKERDAAIRGDIEDVRIVRFANGQFDFSGGPVKYISEYFAQMFEKGKGEYFNSMEIVFNHPKAGEMVLSAQRKRGLTPNEQRKTAEAERDALAAANAVLEAKVAGLATALEMVRNTDSLAAAQRAARAALATQEAGNA